MEMLTNLFGLHHLTIGLYRWSFSTRQASRLLRLKSMANFSNSLH